MASTFWYLEDGRGFARKWTGMFSMLKLINNEIREIKGAKPFSVYLDYFIWDEETDQYNGYGGFIRTSTGEDITPTLDLREFAPENRRFFWIGTQRALRKLIISKEKSKEDSAALLKILLDMHKRIRQREDPNLLNHLVSTVSYSGERKGPGWQ